MPLEAVAFRMNVPLNFKVGTKTGGHPQTSNFQTQTAPLTAIQP
jgi:hypothetical protein